MSLASNGIGFAWCHIMIILTIDRFLHIHLNIKYNLYVTPQRTKLVLCVNYTIAVAHVAVLLIVDLPLPEKLHILYIYMYSVYALLYGVVLVSTYTYIYLKIRANREANRRTTAHIEQSSTRNKSTFVPVWICGTFALFVVIPSVTEVVLVQIVQVEWISEYAYQLNATCWYIGFITDLLIYVLLHECVKNKFCTMIRRGGATVAPVT